MKRNLTEEELVAMEAERFEKGLRAYADVVLKDGLISRMAEERQCQTGEARENVDYVVHHGLWERTRPQKVFMEGATVYENEDEACEWARGSVAGLSGMLVDADADERRRLIDEINAIWIERRVTTTQTIGFMDLSVEQESPL